MSGGDVVKLLLVDDHPVVRLGLQQLCETVPEFQIVGQAATAAEAVTEARRGQPDVVLMDVRLPDRSGVEACREIQAESPQTRVVMLTSYSDEEAIVASIVAGAAGYLLKHVGPDQLIDAIRTVARGGSLLDPAVTQTVLNQVRHATGVSQDDPFASLPEHDRRILPLIAEGKTNREIAAQLFLSEHTVKTYVSEILHKLHLSHRAEVAAFIARHPTTL